MENTLSLECEMETELPTRQKSAIQIVPQINLFFMVKGLKMIKQVKKIIETIYPHTTSANLLNVFLKNDKHPFY